MAVDKLTWSKTFSRREVPALPCPGCRKATLKLDEKTLAVEETERSKKNQKHEAWDPEWTEERFSCLLRCDSAKCGEIVAVSGRVSVEQIFDDDEEIGWNYEGLLEPRSMYPPPPIIALPTNVPSSVREELELAFQFYWGDYGACATKIRTSVERLMDHFKVAKFRIAKNPKKPNLPGKMKPLDLSARIDKFISATGAVVHKDHLHALRIVGNLGTHNNVLSQTEMLEAFEVYEHALEELIGKKSSQIGKLAKKLSKHAGKTKKNTPF
ncbi:MAG: DUF4145 domain-containing protein [Xanthobacteraceae bacterium]